MDTDRDVEFLCQSPVRFQARVVRGNAFVLRHHFAKYLERALVVQGTHIVRRAGGHVRLRAVRADAQIQSNDDSFRCRSFPGRHQLRLAADHADDVAFLHHGDGVFHDLLVAGCGEDRLLARRHCVEGKPGFTRLRRIPARHHRKRRAHRRRSGPHVIGVPRMQVHVDDRELLLRVSLHGAEEQGEHESVGLQLPPRRNLEGPCSGITTPDRIAPTGTNADADAPTIRDRERPASGTTPGRPLRAGRFRSSPARCVAGSGSQAGRTEPGVGPRPPDRH